MDSPANSVWVRDLVNGDVTPLAHSLRYRVNCNLLKELKLRVVASDDSSPLMHTEFFWSKGQWYLTSEDNPLAHGDIIRWRFVFEQNGQPAADPFEVICQEYETALEQTLLRRHYVSIPARCLESITALANTTERMQRAKALVMRSLQAWNAPDSPKGWLEYVPEVAAKQLIALRRTNVVSPEEVLAQLRPLFNNPMTEHMAASALAAGIPNRMAEVLAARTLDTLQTNENCSRVRALAAALARTEDIERMDECAPTVETFVTGSQLDGALDALGVWAMVGSKNSRDILERIASQATTSTAQAYAAGKLRAARWPQARTILFDLLDRHGDEVVWHFLSHLAHDPVGPEHVLSGMAA